MNLTVVTAIHDSGAEIGGMIDSLAALGDPAPEVICVDSGSSDDGPAIAARLGATVIALEGNPGYGSACNAGVAAAAGDVCVLLNPDTRLLDDGLWRLAAAARDSRAILAPRLVDAAGHLEASAHPVPGGIDSILGALVAPRALPGRFRDRLEPFRASRPVPVGWAIGACLVASTRLLRELGPFDPAVFLYAEDMDLCLRAREAGAAVIFRPDVTVVHAGGHSTAALGRERRLELQAIRRREVIGERLGPGALRRDDIAQELTFRLRSAAGRRRNENLAKLSALRAAQKSPS